MSIKVSKTPGSISDCRLRVDKARGPGPTTAALWEMPFWGPVLTGVTDEVTASSVHGRVRLGFTQAAGLPSVHTEPPAFPSRSSPCFLRHGPSGHGFREGGWGPR